MKPLPITPKSYFNKYDLSPVKILPFDSKSTSIAILYLGKLDDLFCDLNVKLIHRGSTAFGIAGKGEVEIGVYPSDDLWEVVLNRLHCHCGQPGNFEENYVRFDDVVDSYEIEIIVLRGYLSDVDQRLTEYLKGHSHLLKEYEDVKKMNAYSKREYQKAKDKFFRSVIEMIPEEQ